MRALLVRMQSIPAQDTREKHLKEPSTTTKHTNREPKMPTHGSLSKAGKVSHKPQKSSPPQEEHEYQEYEADATSKSELSYNATPAKTHSSEDDDDDDAENINLK